MSAWGDCVAAAVARMDDGKTDPVSLAYGVAPQCAPQYQRATEAEVASYITENGQRAQRQLWRDKEVADDHFCGAYPPAKGSHHATLGQIVLDSKD